MSSGQAVKTRRTSSIPTPRTSMLFRGPLKQTSGRNVVSAKTARLVCQAKACCEQVAIFPNRASNIFHQRLSLSLLSHSIAGAYTIQHDVRRVVCTRTSGRRLQKRQQERQACDLGSTLTIDQLVSRLSRIQHGLCVCKTCQISSKKEYQ